MSDQFAVSAFTVIATFILLACIPNIETTLAFVSTVALFAFVQYLERKKVDKLQNLDDQIKALQDKLNVIMIGKGMGR